MIGVARVVLHIPASQSLKDKRQVMKSLIAQVQRQFQLAVAEVEQHDQWQVGVLGVACVSTTAAHADEVIAKAVNFMNSGRVEAELLDFQTEVIHVF